MSTTTTLILGLILNIVILPLALKRVLFLYRLITSGKPAPDRIEGVTGRVSQAIKGQLVEVLGQRKLLKWSIPGIAHAFVMYAFLILVATSFLSCATHSGPIFHTVSYAVTCGIPLMAAVSIYSLEGLAEGRRHASHLPESRRVEAAAVSEHLADRLVLPR